MRQSDKEQRKNKYFGTDGFRGEYGRELTDAHAEAIGQFLGSRPVGGVAKILIGRDTRWSSHPLENALVRGITSVGGEAYLLGVCPTPALSYITSEGGYDAAVMITASHNPAKDNGIKIFHKNGEKLPDEIIALCEDFIDRKPWMDEKQGRVIHLPHGAEIWEKWLVSSSERLCGLRIGLDCANGATYEAAAKIFSSLGAEVHTIGCQPDGYNINEGLGSTHPERLARTVVELGLDMGFAFDGDGDRCIAIDSDGKIIDGDSEMYILASGMLRSGELKNNTVVATIMSNSGFVRALSDLGITCLRTPVGDRFVSEKMRQCKAMLGGEQSGHLIIGSTTGGDGIYTALRLAAEVKKRGMPLGALVGNMTLYPQITESIRIKSRESVLADKHLWDIIKLTEDEIGDRGRILLRPSGTENLIRLMVEHENQDICKQYIAKISKIIKDRSEQQKNEN